jgi:Transposase IS116/IS110/IS902 family
MAHEPEWAPVVTRLPCLRGVSTLTAFALAVEIGDWERFTGSSIGAYLGLVPTENSSGERRSQGSITKAGNMHEGRQHARPPVAGGGGLASPQRLVRGITRPVGHRKPGPLPCQGAGAASRPRGRWCGRVDPAPHQSTASFKSTGSLDVGFADPGHIMAISLHQITVDLLLSNKDVGPRSLGADGAVAPRRLRRRSAVGRRKGRRCRADPSPAPRGPRGRTTETPGPPDAVPVLAVDLLPGRRASRPADLLAVSA